MEIVLPVSLGEALDKLSILDIKYIKINNEEDRNEIKKEYTILEKKIKHYTEKYNYLYDILKCTNLDIWNMLDDIKTKEYKNDEKLKLYEIMWNKNEIRFRIKDRINNLSNSSLKEKKGYNKLISIINICGNNMNFKDLIKQIKYLSFLYDEIIINVPHLDIDKNIFYNIKFIDKLDILEFIDKKYNIFTFSNIKYTQDEINSIFGISNNTVSVYNNTIF